MTREDFEKQFNEIKEDICPVCGYYCLGKGNFGCIDKIGLLRRLCEQADKEHIIKKKEKYEAMGT